MNTNNKKAKLLTLQLIIIIIIQSIRYFPFKFGGWNQIQLSFSYRYGFIQRAFLGTILDIASTAFHIPWKYMRYIHGIVAMGTFTFLMLLIVYKSISKAKDKETVYFLSGLSLLFFMGPGWDTNYSNFALMDIWLPMISLLAVYYIIKDRHLWLVPLLSIICILIHPVYVFLYFNLILVTFFYKIFIISDSKNIKYILSSVVSFLAVSVLFIYLYSYSHVKDGITIDYVMERVSEFVNKPIDSLEQGRYNTLGFLFRTSDGASESIIAINSSRSRYFITEYWLLLVVMIIMFSPFMLEILRYWKYVTKEARIIGRKFFLYTLIPFGVLTVVPTYILLDDYGRWTYAAFFYEFFCIWLLNIINDECIKNATKKMYNHINSHKVYYIILLFYATVIGAFQQNLVSPIVSTIESYSWKLFSFLGV